MHLVLVHEVRKLYGKLPGHARLAPGIDNERTAVTLGNIAPKRREPGVIILQQNRHDAVRVGMHRQKLRTVFQLKALCQHFVKALLDKRELDSHAKRWFVCELPYLQPLGDVRVRHDHLRELEGIVLRLPLCQQVPLQLLCQLLDPVAVVDL